MAQIHPLEAEFGLTYAQILDAIDARPRCKMAVRGAVAEVHLKTHLTQLRDAGAIDSLYEPTGDGKPDFEVTVDGKPYLIECKNVEKEKSRKQGGPVPVTIDFQKTRNQREKGPEGRFYPPDHFSVVAACLWNRTGEWNYMFAATSTLERHPLYPGRLSQKLQVSLINGPIWTDDLPSLLHRPTTQSLSVGQVGTAIPLDSELAAQSEI